MERPFGLDLPIANSGERDFSTGFFVAAVRTTALSAAFRFVVLPVLAAPRLVRVAPTGPGSSGFGSQE